MLKNNRIKSFYNEFTVYLIKDRIYENPRHCEIYKFLDEIFKRKRINSVLEIGCGIGIISDYINKHAPEVYGIDISENNVRFASSTVKNVKFICADFLRSHLNHKFDLITLFDVLEHFPKSLHPIVFEKIREYSKEDTLIVITIPDADFLNYFRQHFPEKLQVVDESIYFKEFLLLLKDFNLEIMAYQIFGIDYENQYRFYLLNYRKEKYVFKKKVNIKQNRIGIVLRKNIKKVQAELRKLKYWKILKNFGNEVVTPQDMIYCV